MKAKRLSDIKARFDVVAIRTLKMNRFRRNPDITILKNAFELAYY